jgi:hypothetical protein
MKKMALMFLLLQTTLLLAAAADPNPADFPVKVHVISSGTLWGAAVTDDVQVLQTVIDKQAVELRATNSSGLLALGDYPARLLAGFLQPKHPNGYDIYRAYDLLMPDGTKRTYVVTRLGPAPSNPRRSR